MFLQNEKRAEETETDSEWQRERRSETLLKRDRKTKQ